MPAEVKVIPHSSQETSQLVYPGDIWSFPLIDPRECENRLLLVACALDDRRAALFKGPIIDEFPDSLDRRAHVQLCMAGSLLRIIQGEGNVSGGQYIDVEIGPFDLVMSHSGIMVPN